MLRGSPSMPGSVQAIATIEIPDNASVCDLDDPARLLEHELRPSAVITRDLAVTQAWALRIHKERRYVGVSWWSYYDARWANVGLWTVADVRVNVEPLTLNHPAISQAAMILRRRIERPSRL